MEQQLKVLPVYQDSPQFSDGGSVLAVISEWVRRGVKAAMCVFNEGRSAVFFGQEGQLYELGKTVQGTHLPSPREVMYNKEPWRLPEAVDLSAVSILWTDSGVLVLDSGMRLHTLTKTGPMTHVLPSRHVAQVACSAYHCLVLTSAGEVYSCGNNLHGQLGLGHTTAARDFTPIDTSAEGLSTRFATWVAVGAQHSAVLFEQSSSMTFGSNAHFQLGHSEEKSEPHPSPALLEQPSGEQFVRAACGANHTLFLTITGKLYGCGSGYHRQLGRLGTNDCTLTELPFHPPKGTLVADVFCDPHQDASAVLTSGDQIHICGQVGDLFNVCGDIEDFTFYKADAVVLGTHVLCMKPPSSVVCIPGFNDPEICDVELVPVFQESELENEERSAEELVQELPPESLRRLVLSALQEGGSLSPRQLVWEHRQAAECVGETAEASGAEGPVASSVFVGYDCIKARSPYLWRLLQSPCQANAVQAEGRKYSVRVQKYSYKALYAYGHYLHYDVVDSEPLVAIELLELAREYMDEGLQERCRRAARQCVTPQNLAACLRGCIEHGHLPLGVDLVKLRLCAENCRDVLRVAERGPTDDPQAEYIREIAMAFAATNPEVLLGSRGAAPVDDRLKGRLLTRLAAAGRF